MSKVCTIVPTNTPQLFLKCALSVAPLTGQLQVVLQQFHNVLGDLAAGRDTPVLRQFLVAAYVQRATAGIFPFVWSIVNDLGPCVPEAALARITGTCVTHVRRGNGLGGEAALARIACGIVGDSGSTGWSFKPGRGAGITGSNVPYDDARMGTAGRQSVHHICILGT